ncbi:MAG TPA: C69 family dipeptidase [Bacteroidales bacterium]|jgi:dipeptidase|nr:dipeptidase [Bacteroidales bacterium]HNY51820.1 C69 family dipeptidase [Bacteroidales bacterium]HOG55959.1 C69 family dipeptidase [Bacteroidales bacterium]HPB12451.1 C69 family dipeptidase [Bacteroidales bacterium]HPX43002.1 C69 family dipeptidase [Bacteroidales bacterium]
MKKLFAAITAIIFSWMIQAPESSACTNLIVTRGASANGSVMITYSADSHVLYGELYHWPSRDYPEGAMLEVWEWDSGRYLGKIPQVRHTYSVVGNMNEYQLSIAETTYGGIDGLMDPEGIMDYGSLIYIALQRAKNAREAIKVISELVSEYGYASSGESLSIADPNEAWILEMTGKGKGNKGAVWVARLIPDGYVCAHANQARIQTFPLASGKKNSIAITSKDLRRISDPLVECVYAHDVIEFARSKGLYNGPDQDFSFSDTFNPVTFDGARFCEIRVWSFFRAVGDDMEQYKAYASGHELSNRMPLWIKPNRKISNYDLMNFMRDHLEGTEFDMRKDIGAGPFGLPYRWRPLTWKVSDDPNAPSYCNERATATQQTGFVFVAESRNWLPDPIGGIFWFGVDDASTTVFNPIYCGITEIPECFRVGNGDMVTYSPTSAFWLFNLVANMCYQRYDLMSEDALKVQRELEKKYISQTVSEIDAEAKKLYETDVWKARDYLTRYSVETAQNTFREWKKLSEYLLVKYIDGNIKKEVNGRFSTSGDGYPSSPMQPGYDDNWKKSVIRDTGTKLLVPAGDSH